MSESMVWLDVRGEPHDPWRYPEVCKSALCPVCGCGDAGDDYAQDHGLRAVPSKLVSANG